ncbi:MAG TPA: type II toxin-antitoxin system RelE/ParE family toxin [Lachnospiraceae bacterium]|nr:type II toxin-antitoxin system RelE/ParE family toxin [Lachnospiraceae bacterium]
MICRQEREEITRIFSLNWKAGMTMQTYDVIILPLAERDIARNTDYILYEKKAPEIAQNLLSGFRSTIGRLEQFPESHELDEDEELAAMQIRKCYYKNYKIFFYINKEKQTVYVLRVMHMLVDAKPLLLNLKFF